jgi:hypothetical protein
MALDPYARLLYWTCANTNAINVTRLENGSAVGVVVKVDGEKPRNIVLHPERGCVKYCNSFIPPPIGCNSCSSAVSNSEYSQLPIQASRILVHAANISKKIFHFYKISSRTKLV